MMADLRLSHKCTGAVWEQVEHYMLLLTKLLGRFVTLAVGVIIVTQQLSSWTFNKLQHCSSLQQRMFSKPKPTIVRFQSIRCSFDSLLVFFFGNRPKQWRKQFPNIVIFSSLDSCFGFGAAEKKISQQEECKNAAPTTLRLSSATGHSRLPQKKNRAHNWRKLLNTRKSINFSFADNFLVFRFFFIISCIW